MRRLRALAFIVTSLILFASLALGQQPVHRIGVLSVSGNPEVMQAFTEGLRERGYVVGRNLQIEHRYSEGRSEQLPALVAELVAFDPEVIVAQTSPNVVAVRAAAPNIPLVFVDVGDPVVLGLVKSLRQPGGNMTGIVSVPDGLMGKQLQLLKELVPQASRIAVLANPTSLGHQRGKPLLIEAARLLGVELVIVEASMPDQLETAFETAHTQGAEAIHIPGDPLIITHSTKIVGLSARYRLPAMYTGRGHVVRDGGLMRYGAHPSDLWRRAAAYVDKILKGERPGDLPVEEPTRFNLVVNLKTAAALGITVPPSILAQADELIE
jgi:ABC-type uncharacterized transport system substrate-binding protein